MTIRSIGPLLGGVAFVLPLAFSVTTATSEERVIGFEKTFLGATPQCAKPKEEITPVEKYPTTKVLFLKTA